MNSPARVVQRLLAGMTCLWAVWPSGAQAAQSAQEVLIVAKVGTVEILRPGGGPNDWIKVDTNQNLRAHWRLHTMERSRVTLQWPDLSVMSLSALTEIENVPLPPAGRGSGLRLVKGIFSFLHKDEPGHIRLVTRGAHAGIEGTEFVVAVEVVNGVERTTLSLIDGRVSLTNEQGSLVLTNGQQAVAEEGKAPVPTGAFIANNVLQWCFYYPAVLDLRDLPLGAAEAQTLSDSLAAYRAGDLLAALASYPKGRQPASDAERIYYAALLLSVGQVAETEAMLAALPAGDPSAPLPRLAGALRQLIAAVKRQPNPSTLPPQLPTELLAAAYHEQSRAVRDASLRAALALARQAATNSPGFSFAWARVAELEFSFGRTGAATEALDKSLWLAPSNAPALALRGFLLAARNRTREAGEWFDRAIAVDPAMGNAWLGRGLVRTRHGDDRGGRADLMVAASLEPQRSALRSYLGKALANAGDTPRALHELELAKKLDPADPTPWLYSALLNQQANRINEGIRDLERSVELNNNRRVYRSQELLDQDRAVRQANLARLYDEAGLGDVALREAGQAVATDYANYSAHLFLANAYQQTRPATPYGQRFETPAVSEYLLTALLGPADGRLLAQPVSQQEYTRLLERNGLGSSSTTEYLSRGAWHQYGAQFGTFDNTSYALEAEYLFDPGQATHSDFESRVFSAKIKQTLTPKDSLFLQMFSTHQDGEDVGPRYDPAIVDPKFSFSDEQSPNVLLGYHREWTPTSHTLVLGSHLRDEFSADIPHGSAWLLITNDGAPLLAKPTDLTRSYSRTYTVDSLELQQVQGIGPHTFILGGRFQSITEKVKNQDAALPGNLSNNDDNFYFKVVPHYFSPENVQADSSRASLYAYDYYRLDDRWLLFGGVTADYLTLARNTISPPLSEASEYRQHLSPSAGLLWQPRPEAVLKFLYSRSITGKSLDQSLRLEPSHLAGIPIAFRSVFPTALTGGLSGEQIELWAVDGRFKLGQDTYAVLAYQYIRSHVDREVGAYTSGIAEDPSPTKAGQKLHFEEHALQFSLRRLIGTVASVGVRYDVAFSKLEDELEDIPTAFCGEFSDCTGRREGVLHTLAFDALAYHSSGFFAGADATWRLQTNLTDTESPGHFPSADFWQFSLHAGYRSPRRGFECRVALLNVTGQDYRLHPINNYLDLPRDRTLALLARLNF